MIYVSVSLGTFIYPIYAILLFFTGDIQGALEIFSTTLPVLWRTFLVEAVTIPFSWVSVTYEIIWDLSYLLYLVYLELSDLIWLFLERYILWLLNMINISLELLWDILRWIANATWVFYRFLVKFTVVFT